MAHLASLTKQIELGSGAVLLTYYSPLQVAESARLLGALHPNRIAIGVGRGPGAEQAYSAALLDGNERAATPARFAAKVTELRDLLREAPGEVQAVPRAIEGPPLWIMATGIPTAEFAGQLGLPMAVGMFLMDAAQATDRVDACLAAYRKAGGNAPVLLVPSVLTAGHERGLASLEKRRQEAGSPAPILAGTHDEVCRGIVALAQRHGVSDVMARFSPVMDQATIRAFLPRFARVQA
jgi:alkanesulfonate monooxygenase SsuD/methylene tetrahydromethanopterin reductase-like flavin-dependent oxidoreductase (luciferase family)